MHLIQLILPLYADNAHRLPRELFDEVKRELVDRFGGVTAFTRSPAEGLWDQGDGVQRDDVVLFEVMVDSLDRSWWATYRRELEKRFSQEEIVVRAQSIQRL